MSLLKNSTNDIINVIENALRQNGYEFFKYSESNVYMTMDDEAIEVKDPNNNYFLIKVSTRNDVVDTRTKTVVPANNTFETMKKEKLYINKKER